MTKYLRKLFLLTYILLVFLLMPPTSTHAAPSKTSVHPIHAMVKDVLRLKATSLGETYILSSPEFLSHVGTPSYDGYALAIARLGTERGYDSYLSLLYNEISADYVKDKDTRRKEAHDWLTTYLTLLALGGDPANITNTVTGDTINLLANYTYHYTSSKTLYEQGTETIAYALLAMDSLDYIIPENSTYTRDDLIDALINAQHGDGSFSSNSHRSDSILTSLVIQALAPFYNDSPTVRSVIIKAINFLSSKQTAHGDIRNGDQATLEATSMVLQACTSIGIDPYTDVRFFRSGQTLLDGLSRYQTEDGGFCNIITNDEAPTSDDSSNIHALNGLIAYYRFSHNQRSFYDMREEQTVETKQRIADLEASISSLNDSTDKATLASLYETYLSLNVFDRRYVYHYEGLEQALVKKQISIQKLDVADALNKVNAGNGFLYNIINNCEITVSKNFTMNDFDLYAGLASPLTQKDYPPLTLLYCKLANTDPALFHIDGEETLTYEALLSEMKAKKTGLETNQMKIDQINEQIKEKLPPLSTVTKEDKDLIDQLVYLANGIPEEDHALILAYDELLAAKERLAPKSLFGSSSRFLFVIFLVLFSPMLFNRRKKE